MSIAALASFGGGFLCFDFDPIHSRLLAGEEEKDFCEPALADLADSNAKYLRNTAVAETTLTDGHGAQVRMRNGRLMRNIENDDFGAPETAFLACNFWYTPAKR